MFHRIRKALGRFALGETGAVVAEAVIVLPLFLWAYIGLYVYWDAFRSNNAVQKAAFTVADLLSREQDVKTKAYIDGLQKLIDYLIDENQSARIRVTSILWDDVNKRFDVHWSASPEDRMTALTTASLQPYAREIPDMSPGDYAIILEVETDYVPAFDIGMDNQKFREFVVIRPRFAACLRLDGAPTCAGA